MKVGLAYVLTKTRSFALLSRNLSRIQAMVTIFLIKNSSLGPGLMLSFLAIKLCMSIL